MWGLLRGYSEDRMVHAASSSRSLKNRLIQFSERGDLGRGGLGSGKTSVVEAVERGGEGFAKSTKSVDAKTLKPLVRENVSHR